MDITPNMEIQIVEDYKNGLSRFNIVKKYNSHDKKIIQILNKNNVTIRDLSESHSVLKFDKTFFKKIDTEEKAYWLGFIYADGNLHKNTFQICLHSKDENHLIKLKNALKSESTIKNDRGYKRFSISNKEMANDLIKLGCVPQKTFKLQFPTQEQVPICLIRHFMRGYFDGDGCITYHKKKGNNNLIRWKINVISCLDFIEQYKTNLLEMANIESIHLYKEPRREKPIYILTVQSQTNLKLNKLYDFFYKDATIFLERKKNKFIELNNLLINNLKIRELIGNSNKIGLLEEERRIKILKDNFDLPLSEICKLLNFSIKSCSYVLSLYKKYNISRKICQKTL